MIAPIISCCLFFFINCAENCNNIVSPEQYQPRKLWQYAGRMLAQEYTAKSASEKDKLLQKWMKELPQDAWSKIRELDPLAFLHFKKMDLLMSHVSQIQSEGFNNKNWDPSICGLRYQYGHLENARYARYYILINNLTEHIEKKVWANSGHCHFLDVSDVMFVWAFNDLRKIFIFDPQNNVEYSSTLDNYTWKVLSNTECGVFYLFHEMNDFSNKTLKKMVCTPQASKILHTIDISFFKNSIYLVQTSDPNYFLLHDTENIYAYNAVAGDLTKINIPFSFDAIHVNSTGSMLAFIETGKIRETGKDFFASVRVCTFYDLENPLYVLHNINASRLTFMKHTNLLIFFNENGSHYYDEQAKQLKNLNSYNLVFKRNGLNPLVVRDASSNDLYCITDHFEMMQKSIKDNQNKDI